jgi:hypothetical protein
VAATQVDWSDGSPVVTTEYGTGAFPSAGLNLSHHYASAGGYTISWSYTADRVHLVKFQVTVEASAPQAPPDAQLDVSNDGSGQALFAASDTSGVAWTHWLLDFGDGSYATGTDQASFGNPTRTHGYSPGAHTALLTVVDADGQLATVSAAAP